MTRETNSTTVSEGTAHGTDGGPAFPRAALEWIVGNQTGMSSKNIWSHMMGVGRVNGFAPQDPSDFGRCARLLTLVPAWRDRIAEMAAYGIEWAAIARRWDDVHRCMDREVGIDWSKGGDATETYRLMKLIYVTARKGGDHE